MVDKETNTTPLDRNRRQSVKLPNAILIPEIISMINEGHSVTLPLRGNSMRPFLEHERDKALLTAVKTSDIKVGDAVLAEIKPSLFVLHRITKIEGEDVTMCGDGNLTFEYCKLSNVKAKAVAFYRKGRETADKVDGRKWKVYSKVWVALFPIRRYLLFIYRQYLKIIH